MPRFLPVTPQAQTPSAYIQAMMPTTTSGSPRSRSSHQSGNATSVPAVPGAKGDRPAPKPSAMKCAGWLKAKRACGRAMIIRRSCCEVIEAARGHHAAAVAVEDLQAAPLADRADTREL